MDEQTSGVSGVRRRHREHLNPARPHRVSLRLSHEERGLVEAAAARAGLTVAGYVVKAAVAQAGDDTGAAGATPTGGLRELQRELFAARRAVVLFGSNVNQAAVAFNSTGELPCWVTDAVRLCARAVTGLDEVTARIHRRLR